MGALEALKLNSRPHNDRKTQILRLPKVSSRLKHEFQARYETLLNYSLSPPPLVDLKNFVYKLQCFQVAAQKKKHAKSFDMKFDLNFQRVIIAIALKIPLSWYKGGGIETPPPRVFVLWQYCETILFSVESLLSSLKDTNNGCHLAHRLGFHQELEVRLKPRNGDFCWA